MINGLECPWPIEEYGNKELFRFEIVVALTTKVLNSIRGRAFLNETIRVRENKIVYSMEFEYSQARL